MLTTSLGFKKPGVLDPYTEQDVILSVDRMDKNLAKLGMHSSRYFSYIGTSAATSLGVTMLNGFTLTDFKLIGKGEAYYIQVVATRDSDITNNSALDICRIPDQFSVGNTESQFLGSAATGMGINGYIATGGRIVLGARRVDGTTLKIPAGESVELAGWYYPVNSLGTAGIIPPKSANSMDFSAMNKVYDDIDLRADAAKTKLVWDNNPITSGVTFNLGANITSVDSYAFRRYGAFCYVRISFNLVVGFSLSSPRGNIANQTVITITDSRFTVPGSAGLSGVVSPLRNESAVKTGYGYHSASSNVIGMGAVGFGSAPVASVTTGNTLYELAGMYRIA